MSDDLATSADHKAAAERLEKLLARQRETYGTFDAKPAPEYEERESRELDRQSEIYASKRVSRPAYTREDPPCEVCGMSGMTRFKVEKDPDDPDDDEKWRTVDQHAGADHPWRGTVRITGVRPGYDKATFPIVKKNAIARMKEDELISPEGSLWRLQQLIGDAKFELLKKCVAAGVHMVTDIEAEVVVRVEAKTLTDKAGSIVRVKEGVEEVSILLPNGDFKLGGY